MTTRSALAMVVVAAIVTAPTLAQERSGSGEGIVVTAPDKDTELPGRGFFREVGNNQILIASDASHPFHHVAISCSGTCTMSSDKKTGTCAGGCNGRDPNGDVLTFSWDGLDHGGWKLIGGSGKWSAASGSGTWKSEGPMGAGFMRNTWTGSIRMK